MSTRSLSGLAGMLLLAAGVTAQAETGKTVTVRNEVYSVAPTESGNRTLGMDLYVPSGGEVKGAVILIHGGAFVSGSRELRENRVYGNALAERGYLAAAISYRLHGDRPVINRWARNYAEAVRRSSNGIVRSIVGRYGPNFPKAVAASAQDVMDAVSWLREHAAEFAFDPDDVALFGASAGAISALTVAYVIDKYGVGSADIAAVIEVRGLLIRPEGAEDLMASPGPPLLMFHGEDDERVPAVHAESLFKTARDAGIDVEYYSASGHGHDLGGASLLNMYTHVDETVLDRIDGFLSAVFSDSGTTKSSVRSRLAASNEAVRCFPSARSPMIDGSDPGPRVTAAVDALLEDVDEEPGWVESLYGISRRNLLLHDFDGPARYDWSYWPRKRAGLSLRYMTAKQRSLTQDILHAILSARGYLQVVHVIQLEEILTGFETSGFSRGAEDYTITVFGRPDDTRPWGFRFEGHHLSLNVTVAAGDVTVTPSFIGAAPSPVASGPLAGFSPLKPVQRTAFELLSSLDKDQRETAIVADEPPGGILTGQYRVERSEWEDWHERLGREGVSTASFNARQKRLLYRLLIEFVGIYRDEVSIGYLDGLEMNSLSFAWMGASRPGRPHYFRIRGETFVLELDATQDDGKHVHTVWRDVGLDFGRDLLGRHYRERRH